MAAFPSLTYNSVTSTFFYNPHPTVNQWGKGEGERGGGEGRVFSVFMSTFHSAVMEFFYSIHYKQKCIEFFSKILSAVHI